MIRASQKVKQKAPFHIFWTSRMEAFFLGSSKADFVEQAPCSVVAEKMSENLLLDDIEECGQYSVTKACAFA